MTGKIIKINGQWHSKKSFSFTSFCTSCSVSNTNSAENNLRSWKKFSCICSGNFWKILILTLFIIGVWLKTTKGGKITYKNKHSLETHIRTHVRTHIYALHGGIYDGNICTAQKQQFPRWIHWYEQMKTFWCAVIYYLAAGDKLLKHKLHNVQGHANFKVKMLLWAADSWEQHH